MVLPLSTPGSCCGHNLNMHSGNGLEGTCLVCSCVGFVPDMEDQMAKMISGPQCQARYVWEDRDAPPLQCELDRGHLGEQDHKHGDIRWTDTIALYPDVHEVLKTLRDSTASVTMRGTRRSSARARDVTDSIVSASATAASSASNESAQTATTISCFVLKW